MSKLKIWHNPRCSKSRNALSLLEEKKEDFEIIKYLDTPPSIEELKELLKMLGFSSARELMRAKEEIYKELGLKDETDEEKLIEAMVKHPRLIERPIVIKGDKAVVGRPIENIEKLLEE
ncbi:MAG: arsenate reductase (glutaredoxin) [Sulfurospirillum sp.]|nr:MAG: arsenate reductase (glutaredoxin) [Sulfurospirillum sp.]